MTSFRHNVLNERTLCGKFRAISQEPLPVSSHVREILAMSKPCESAIWEDLIPLFFTYRSPSAADFFAMEIIIEGFQDGSLGATVEFISVPPDIDEPKDVTEPRRGRVIESAEHIAMKEWVRLYLLHKGVPAAPDEVSKLGYEVDVGSLKTGTFVECGDTEPNKVLDFLRHGFDIGILQYDSEDILWFNTSPQFKTMVTQRLVATTHRPENVPATR